MWITDWSKIDPSKMYIVSSINARDNKTLYLSGRLSCVLGWYVVRLLHGCYAALEMPEWNGVVEGKEIE